MFTERSNRFYWCCVIICNFIHIINSQDFGTGEGNSCTTNSGKNGICKLFDNCQDIEALYAEGGQPKICGWTNGDAIVCCPQTSKSEESKFQVLTQVQTQQWVSNKTIVVHISEKAPNGTIINATEIHNYVEPVKHVINTNITTINSTDCTGCTPSKNDIQTNTNVFMFVSTPQRHNKTASSIQEIINRFAGVNNYSVSVIN